MFSSLSLKEYKHKLKIASEKKTKGLKVTRMLIFTCRKGLVRGGLLYYCNYILRDFSFLHLQLFLILCVLMIVEGIQEL